MDKAEVLSKVCCVLSFHYCFKDSVLYNQPQAGSTQIYISGIVLQQNLPKNPPLQYTSNNTSFI